MKLEEVTKEWLEQKYYGENLGVYEISLILKIVDTKLISSKLEEFGIPKKKKGRQKIETPNTLNNQTEEEKQTIVLEGEELEVGDRLRLKETTNSIKATQLCEIIKIYKDGRIKIRAVYDHSTLDVSIDQVCLD